MNADLHYSDVAQLLKPDFTKGLLFWLPRSPDLFAEGKQLREHSCKIWNSRFAGTEAFTAYSESGYRTGRILGFKYQSHRVIWLLHTGNWPADQIDHINGIRSDNRIVNLRAVTNAENCKNQRKRLSNTSGVVGVGWCKTYGKWTVTIAANQKEKKLGRYDDFDAAVAARKSAEIEYGYHENHGRAF